MATNFYRSVTDQIVAELEKGVRPWRKPWDVRAAACRFGSAFWLTYRQPLDLGGQVRKEEKSALV